MGVTIVTILLRLNTWFLGLYTSQLDNYFALLTPEQRGGLARVRSIIIEVVPEALLVSWYLLAAPPSIGRSWGVISLMDVV